MNPWARLPSRRPFVLHEDRAAVNAFNRAASERACLHLELLPEPFIGNLKAPVLFLALNPGYKSADRRVHRRAAFRALVRACYSQRPTQYPNYYLNPRVVGGGALWWARVTAPLIREFGVKAVATNVAALEYVPYHSERFSHSGLHLPSQSYTFAAVRTAMDRGAVIFVTRGRALWEAAVPGLASYRRAFTTNSRQNVSISPNNSPRGFRAAQAALRAAAV